MLPLSPPCEVNLIQNLGVFLLIFLLFSFLEHKEEDKRGSAEAEDENAADSKRPCAVFTGHRSLKATRIYNLQRSDCVLEPASISSSSIVTSLPSTVADAV